MPVNEPLMAIDIIVGAAAVAVLVVSTVFTFALTITFLLTREPSPVRAEAPALERAQHRVREHADEFVPVVAG